MTKVKPEEASVGVLRDPTEAEETGNTKAKTQMHDFTIGIFNCLVDPVEANKARIGARMEVIPEANEAKGDTIKEGLEEAIDLPGSSSN
uniref:Uncharacterized protein n=1 Tax=Romanomermis culicivorax TaxID=13658 RepID=A0A915J1Q8_ROMCU